MYSGWGAKTKGNDGDPSIFRQPWGPGGLYEMAEGVLARLDKEGVAREK
jgi:hypothetical protein